MRVLSQLLGRYSSKNKPLIIFRLPDTDTILYRQSDIEPLFSLPPLSFQEVNYDDECYQDLEDTYLNTQVLEELADHFKRDILAELCKFRPNDYALGLADDVLNMFPQFKRAPTEEHVWESVQLPLEKLQDVLEREAIKSEPSSPLCPIESRNPMALNKVLLHTTTDIRQTISSNKRQRISLYPPISEEPSCSSKKNARNLTIFAPSYTEHLVGIKSAPINRSYTKLVQPRRHEFAIPPVVPSQQVPHSAHPTSRDYHKLQHNTTQRQQHLQPFEQLFDTIESTRTLKSTLDNQIRRSSSLIQTLQASANTIQGLVKDQVQKEWDSLLRRIEILEKKHFSLSEKEDIQSPPRSQNDIKEYQSMLNALKDRIDRLERHIEA